MDNNNINLNSQVNKNLKSIIILLIVLILIILFTLFNKNSLVPDKQSPEINSSPIATPEEIISKEIMESVNPNADDQFWASMYRKDSKTGKMYFVINREKNSLIAMTGADAQSFKVLSSYDGAKYSYAKDQNGIYCNNKLRPDISSDTFIYNRWTALYAKDKNTVYVNCEASDINPQNFKQLGQQGLESNYATDKNGVYYKGKLLTDSNPLTFQILDLEGHSKDDKNLYFEDKLIGHVGETITNTSTGKITLTSRPPYTAIFDNGTESNILNNISIFEYWASGRLRVHNQKIYFTDPQGNLEYFDLLSNSVHTIPLNLTLLDDKKAPKFVDYFLQRDDIYILYGENCNDYLARCNLDLLKYNLQTGSLDKILSNVNAREIIGFDEETNNLYLAHRDGDAGCTWSTYYVFNVTSRNLTSAEVSGCYEAGSTNGGAEYITSQEKTSKILEKIKGDIVYSDEVYIKNGKIVLPPDIPLDNQNLKNILYYIN